MNLDKTYNPSAFEDKIYKQWMDGNYFRAKVDKEKIPFTIVIPPPNITGQLHMGHALNNSIQDAIIRFKRMQGYSTLWLPGTDHASIATEVKIVEKMKADEGLTKNDIGREGFLARAWEWKKQYGGRIVEQLKKLGSSCDWSREAFTMDDNCSNAVKHVFVNLYNKGLIYKGDRIINWCPSCKTALSDAEVEYEEDSSFLWHFRYPFADGSGDIVVATTRPETILGDTAVAVNPKDARYLASIGKMLILPILNKEIPLVGDDYVEKDFGSGAVKITPAHDPNDFEVGMRHNLEVIRVMNDDGSMNSLAGKYEGMDRSECRKAIVEDLKNAGFLVKIEPYNHNVGKCYRCHEVVEQIVSSQWFVKMEPLAKPAIDVVKKRKIDFLPKNFEKTYFNWMENIRDWCISRQLWWGHRIPAFYCDECGNMMVQEDAPTGCSKCGHANIRQDEDVLDTWFSSALWPFSTLGYPTKTKDLQYFYPTSVLVTAYDIIFFWVARMIFSGIEHMGEIPFDKVLIHGIVRDKNGKKMSKSLGNGIDPLEVIKDFGADSLRLSLLMGIAVGGDTRYNEEKVLSSRNFINKLWNAARFVNMHTEKIAVKPIGTFRLAPADKWILSKLNTTIKEVTRSMEKFDLGLACSEIYDFLWNDFCDWYIELSKAALYSDNALVQTKVASVLHHVLLTVIKLLHPFAPFVTEEIYSSMQGAVDKVMVSQWPTTNKKFNYTVESREFEKVMDIIKAIRNLRAEMNVVPSKKLNLIVCGANEQKFNNLTGYIAKLCNIDTISYATGEVSRDNTSVIVSDFGDIIVPLGDLVDVEKEKERITAELEKVVSEITRAEGMLSNAGFVSKAPKAKIDAEKEKLAGFIQLRDKLGSQLEKL